jgi:hypothetical protein
MLRDRMMEGLRVKADLVEHLFIFYYDRRGAERTNLALDVLNAPE